MTCVHKVRWSVKRPEDCRFRLSVSHYKDRIVAPDEYSGATTVTPSDDTQTLPTKDKTVRSDIAVLPAPVESLATSENGTFLPSDGNIGFSSVTVDVEPNLTSLTVTENGLYLPESGVDGFDRVSVNVPVPSGSTTITQNGTYDVSTKASAVVAVPSQAPVTEPLSVTQNGTYTPESGVDGFDEVVVNVPTGGGGGLTLIDTINANGVRNVQTDIDASWFDDYDYVLLVPDLTFSASDWLYVIADATSGGNEYAPKTTSIGVSQGITLGMVSGHVVGAWFKDGTNRPSTYIPQSYLYWYMYYASTTMTGTIKIYGIKVTS